MKPTKPVKPVKRVKRWFLYVLVAVSVLGVAWSIVLLPARSLVTGGLKQFIQDADSFICIAFGLAMFVYGGLMVVPMCLFGWGWLELETPTDPIPEFLFLGMGVPAFVFGVFLIIVGFLAM